MRSGVAAGAEQKATVVYVWIGLSGRGKLTTDDALDMQMKRS